MTTDSTAYTNPRELVLKEQAREQIDMLDEGLRQWRAIAGEAIALAARLQAAGAASGTASLSTTDRRDIERLAVWQRLDAQVILRAPAASTEGPVPSTQCTLSQNLAMVTDYVHRTTHWREGRPDRHDAIQALKEMPAQVHGRPATEMRHG